MLRNRLIIIILVAFLGVSIIRYISSLNTFIDSESLIVTILTALLAFVLLLLADERISTLKRNYLKICFVFSISFIVVHYFEYIGYLFGVKQYLVSSESYSLTHINESAICSLCSFLSFALGYMIMLQKKEKIVSEKKATSQISIRFLDVLMPISVILFYYLADKRYFQAGGNYLILNNGGLSDTASMFQAVFLGAQGVYSIAKIMRGRKNTLIEYFFSFSLYYYISVLAYTFLVLKSGDRGPILYVTISYILPFFVINKKKINLKTAVICVVFGAIILNFLGVLRNVSGELSYEKFSETNTEMQDRYRNENALFISTEQLSNVVRAYNVVYDYTNENGSINGLGFLNNLSGIIPGLRSYVIYPFFDIDEANMLSSDYLSTVLLRSDHGMGTTCVGDTYYNFGFIGCVIVFFLFGILCRYLDTRLYDINSCPVFIYICAFWYIIFAIYIGRSSVLAPISYCGYTYFILLIARMFQQVKKINE